MTKKYYILDPIGSPDSGVTKYSLVALQAINALGFNCEIIQKSITENIEEFRLRLARFFEALEGDFVIEAPETLAATKYLDGRIPVHIRLHFSKVLGGYVENKPMAKKIFNEENDVISKAVSVSSPSYVGLDLARKFFDLPAYVSVYENPIQSLKQKRNCKYDVGFVGRWQNLKGIAFFKLLIERNPHLSFCLVSSVEAKVELCHYSHVTVLDTSQAEKLYSECKSIVVLSLFETASMVALEALAAGTKVVAWAHLGVCEYASKPLVYSAAPFSIDALEVSLFESLADVSLSKNQYNSFVKRVNDSFSSGVINIIDNSFFNSKYMMKGVSFFDGKDAIEEGRVMLADQSLTARQRKFKKFRTKPVKFFVDMYRKRRGSIVVPVIKTGGKPSVLFTKAGKPIKTLRKARRRNSLFCNITDWSSPSFHDFGELNSDFRVVFLFDKKQYIANNYKNLLEKVYANEDFFPLRRKELSRGYLDYSTLDTNDSAVDILDSISHKERNKLENIKFLFVFDCSDTRILDVFRAINPKVALVAVYTSTVDDKFFTEVGIAEKIDVLITTAKEGQVGSIRKLYSYSSSSHIPDLCRKVIQEMIPKPYPFMLPILGGQDYKPNLEYFNTELWGGILILNNPVHPAVAGTFAEFIQAVAPTIRDIYLREDVYLRYKSLCDNLGYEKNLELLLSFSLRDGVMYHVV